MTGLEDHAGDLAPKSFSMGSYSHFSMISSGLAPPIMASVAGWWQVLRRIPERCVLCSWHKFPYLNKRIHFVGPLSWSQKCYHVQLHPKNRFVPIHGLRYL